MVPYTDDDGNLMHLNNTITKGGRRLRRIQVGFEGAGDRGEFRRRMGCRAGCYFRGADMKGSDDEGVMASFKDDLEVRIKPLEEAHPDLKINKQIVPGPAVGALTKARL